MNKKVKGFIILIITIFIFNIVSSTKVYAAGDVSISADSTKGYVDDVVTVNVTVNLGSINAFATQLYIEYDKSILDPVDYPNEGYILIIDMDPIYGGSKAYPIEFRIIGVGNSYIRVRSAFENGNFNAQYSFVGDEDENKPNLNISSGKVTASAPPTYSSDNTLSSLEISPGVLSPAFSPDITRYTTTVDADCTQLIVNAIKNDSSAKVSISGKKLNYGKNTTTITVTAENGDSKYYTITTIREGGESESVTDSEGESEAQTEEQPQATTVCTVNGASYELQNDFEQHPLPAGYEVVDYVYKDESISVGKGTNTGLILMYLNNTDGKGKSGFFIYDADKNTFSPYYEVLSPALSYVILPLQEDFDVPQGYNIDYYQINGQDVEVLLAADKKSCLFYGACSDGRRGWFRYDCTDGSIQMYQEVALVDAQNKSDTEASAITPRWKYIAFALMASTAIFIALFIVFAVKGNKIKKQLMSVIRNSTSNNNMNTAELTADEGDTSDNGELLADDYEEPDLPGEDLSDDQTSDNDTLIIQEEKYQNEAAAALEEDELYAQVSEALKKNISNVEEDDNLDVFEVEDK